MSSAKILALGCDHAGFEYKEAVREMLEKEGYTVTDFGTYSPGPVDYPDFVRPVCKAIERKEADLGILLCGSANGVAIMANRYLFIRAAVCWTNDIARLARQHNDANVICLPTRFASLDLTKSMLHEFLAADFEGGRHQRRVEKMSIL